MQRASMKPPGSASRASHDRQALDSFEGALDYCRKLDSMAKRIAGVEAQLGPLTDDLLTADTSVWQREKGASIFVG